MGEKKKIISIGLLAAATCVFGATPNANPSDIGKAVVLEINGAKITLGDLEEKHSAALYPARNAYYDAERKILEGLAEQSLLEQQAKKEGLTVDKLLEKHVTSILPTDPSEEALRVFYEGLDSAQPFDEVRDKILDSIRQRRMAKAKSAYLSSLRKDSTIIIKLAPPRAPISMKDVALREVGSPQITVLEFGDYECPYTQQAQAVVAKLETEFKGKIAFAYKDFPLPMHPHAQKAAEATHCAAEQGKYWEFHDLLFDRKQLDEDSLKRDASDLKLDTAKFQACLDSGKTADIVQDQGSEASAIGVPGDPTFFVNGRSVGGSNTFERIGAVINEELSALSLQAASAKSTESRAPDGERSH